jgi:anti-anti-sigma factor
MKFIEMTTIQGPVLNAVKEPVLITVFHVKDNVNMGNYRELIQEAEKVYQEGARNLILDLADVRMISSAGIGGIVTIAKIFNSEAAPEPLLANRHLRVCNCTPMMFTTFEIAGLVEVLGVCKDLQGAVASLVAN